ncbi:MAG: ABC transporter permease subunit [Clostridia bacterium]|nr:ABC transporter permease subunit [Clostridia bacterium]
MFAIYRREMQSYFYTSSAYVFLGVFLGLGSIFFGVTNLAARSSNLLALLSELSYLWMLLSPILTMRLIAGERQRGTNQMLLASPCSMSGIVLGKYLAACSVLLVGVVSSMMYACVVAVYGRLYAGETAVAYAGLILQGCAFIALDLFVSCFAKSQMTAVMMGIGVNLLVWMADVLASAVTIQQISRALDFISLYQRFAPFVRGQLSLSNVMYYLFFIAVMVFLSVRVLDARRWSEA